MESDQALTPPASAPKDWATLLPLLDLGPEEIAVDGGANVGVVTAQLAARGATVYAFEPNPHAFRVLQARFHGHPNVHCHQQGVWDRPDRQRLYLHQNAEQDQVYWSTGSSLLAFKGNVNPATSVEIELIDLAAFVLALPRPVSLMKLDVEGAECRVIHHLIDTGAIRRIRLLLAETHDVKIPALREETDRLRHRLADERLTQVRLDWF